VQRQQAPSKKGENDVNVKNIERENLQITTVENTLIQRAGVCRRLVQKPADTGYNDDCVTEVAREQVKVARVPVYEEWLENDEEEDNGMVAEAGAVKVPGEVEVPPEEVPEEEGGTRGQLGRQKVKRTMAATKKG